MRNRVILILAIWIGVFVVGYLSVRQSSIVFEKEKIKNITVTMEALAATAKQSIDTEIILLGNRLSDFVGYEIGMRQTPENYQSESPFSDFDKSSDFLALGVLPTKSSKNFDWVAIAQGSQNRVSRSTMRKWLSDIPMASLSNNKTLFTRVLDGGNRPLFVVTLELGLKTIAADSGDETENPIIALGVVSPQFFEKVASSTKISGDELILVDQSGYALTYTETQYVGAKLDKHPMVSEILKSREAVGSGQFSNLYGEEIIGAFTRFEKTNLFIGVATKTSLYKPQLMPAFLSMILYIIIVGLFMSAFVFAIRSETLGFNASDFMQALRKLASGKSLDFEDDEKIEYSTVAHFFSPHIDADEKIIPHVEPAKLTEADKQKIIKQMGVGISESLKGPMAAILGHAQLARSKTSDEGVKEHFVVIERESRKAREMLDNLLRSVGESEIKSGRVDMQETILACLAGFRGEISHLNIQLKKELQDNGSVMAQSGLLQLAFNEILKNSIEAVKESTEKIIHVRSLVKDKSICLEVKDSGSGIPSDRRARIFEPFFSTKDGEENVGMGLNTAMGIIKSFDGEISVEADSAGGTVVTVSLPLVSSQRMERLDENDIGEKTDVAIPSDESIEMTKKVDLGTIEMTKKVDLDAIESEVTNPKIQGSYDVGHELTDPKISSEEENSAELTNPIFESTDSEPNENTFEVKKVEDAIPSNSIVEEVTASNEESTLDRLAGKSPIVGTKAEELPTAPAVDEITFTGVNPEHAHIISDDDVQTESVSIEISGVGNEENPSDEDKNDDNVKVRSPKVRY